MSCYSNIIGKTKYFCICTNRVGSIRFHLDYFALPKIVEVTAVDLDVALHFF